MSRVPLALHQAVEAALSREIRLVWSDMHAARNIAATTRHYDLGIALRNMARHEEATLRRLLRIRRAARQAAVPSAVTPPAPECDCFALTAGAPTHSLTCAIETWRRTEIATVPL